MILNCLKILLIIILLIFSIKRKLKISTAALAFVVLFNIYGLISFKDSIKCFSSDSIVIYFSLSIITESLIKNGFIDYISNMFVRRTKSLTTLIVMLSIAFSLITIVISSKITILVFLNLIFSIEKNYKLKISNKTGIIFRMAGVCVNNTIVTFSTKLLLANEILLAFGESTIPTFYFLPFSVINLAILIAYVLIRKNDIIEKNIKIKKVSQIPLKNISKNIISIITLLSCIFVPIFINVDTGLVCICGAIICILGACLSEKEAISSVNWWIIIYLGSIKAICKALKDSNIFDYIGNMIQKFITPNTSILVLLIIISLCSAILCYILDSKFTISTLTPIALIISKNLGLNPLLLVSAIVIGNIFYMLSPIDMSNIIIMEQCDISVKDIFKFAFPYCVIVYVVSIFILYLTYLFNLYII